MNVVDQKLINTLSPLWFHVNEDILYAAVYLWYYFDMYGR